MPLTRRPLPLILFGLIAIAAVVLLTQQRWLLASGTLAGAFAVQAVIKPSEPEPTRWIQALLGPAIAGLIAGAAAYLPEVVTRGSSCREWGCPIESLMFTVLGLPALALAARVVFWLARTPQPWLTAVYGTMAGLALMSPIQLVLAVPQSRSFLFVSFIVGYLLTALALGPILTPIARAVVFTALIMALPVTEVAQHLSLKAESSAGIERLTVPLLAPTVPGYKISSSFANEPANTLVLELRPENDKTLNSLLTLSIGPIPAGFNPPSSCDLAPRLYGAGTCVPDDNPGTWHLDASNGRIYLVRRDNALVIIQSTREVSAETLLAAALSLHPVTSRELMP